MGGSGIGNSGAITTLTNGGAISGGNGGAGNFFIGVVGGAGGAGVSNSGMITTLTNSGAISGGNGGAGISGRRGRRGRGGRLELPARSRR